MQKAVIRGVGQPLQMETCEVMDTPPGGARIHIQYAGVCHTDTAYIDSTLDMGDGNTFEFSKFSKHYIGSTVGHEICGIVEDLRFKVDASKCHVKVGDRVAVYPTLGCPSCSGCTAEDYNGCLSSPEDQHGILGLGSFHGGGFSTHLTVPDPKFLFPLPESIPSDIGCMLACSTITAYGAILKCREVIEQAAGRVGVASLLLIGIGGVGLWGVRLAKVTLKENIQLVVADIDKDKLDLGLEAGADETVLWNPDEDVNATVALTTADMKRKFSAVIDFVGTNFTFKAGLECLAPQGKLVMVGFHGGGINLSAISIVLNAVEIQGSKNGSPAELRRLIELIDSENITFPWTEEHQLKDVNDVIARLREGKVKGRAMIKM